MIKSRIIAALFTVALVCAYSPADQPQGSPAESKPGPKPMPQVESVINHIPSGTMGFVVINKAGNLTDKVDNLIDELGFGQMLGPKSPGRIMSMVVGAAQLGEGFNPNGGFAAVMMDPQQFGIDLMKMMTAGRKAGRRGPATAPTMPPTPEKKPPFVLFIPATGIQELFSNYSQVKAGKYVMVNLRMGKVFATKCGGYVAVSPNVEALAAALSQPAKLATELTASQAKIIQQADLTYHINMKIAAPMLNKAIQGMEDKISATTKPGSTTRGTVTQMHTPFAGMVAVLPMYRQMISSLDAVTVTIKLADTGIVMEELIAFSPDSNYAKMMAFYASSVPSTKSLVRRLPNLPYVMAFGYKTNPDSQQALEGSADLTSVLFKLPMFSGLDEQMMEKIRTNSLAMQEQVLSVQIVAGGPAAGSGLFGISEVIECKDTEKFKSLLTEQVGFLREAMLGIYSKMLPPEMLRKFEQLQLEYVKDVEKVGEVSVDAITISHPEIGLDDPEKLDKIQKLLGEGKVRVLVAYPDSKTAIISFGGGVAYMAQAIKASKGIGNIGAEVSDAEAIKHMPAGTSMVGLLNGYNLLQLIASGAEAFDPDGEPLPVKFTCKTPVAFGFAVRENGNVAHVSAYIPTGLVKDMIGMFGQLMAARHTRRRPSTMPTTAPTTQPQ